ncbi:uncharacterized membrane protein YcaP (DUF421 family) [Virgibacillus natechei]|uniref:Uncharacterized membrane protein YcaP (DUF421 family) n=1 Tax=Virgibacillus natechei TaxID=1216297 RepID=A0ABS4IJB0_9BACI|nr:DUF421 domain-containing protein [Virgibacillus natechei]MBP1971007.1 uncharacterized membrane protein YcaP (DUF421 family) [Virgibacillus natechei]UZD12766.1 DUF421 domain-containing protein [Virgibacillus natechei]
MEFDWIWKAVAIIIGGTFILRMAGRKSISQMTLTQTVIMIGIGSLFIQPVAGENIWVTFGVGAILVMTLFILEVLQVKVDFIETLITGKSKIVIENGVLQEKELKKLRITADQLEMKLRQQSVARISDVQWATLEPNGQVGYTLKPEAQAVTKKELQQLKNTVQETLDQIELHMELPNPNQQNQVNNQPLASSEQEDLFAEVKRKTHKNVPPKHLR